MSAAVFLGILLLYLVALPPSLAPWRDTGEMTTAVATLGVAHPTSYPLYVLLGRLADALPLGNPAYRLNLLSAAAGAGACALLFGVLRRRHGVFPGLLAAGALALNPSFWAAAQVSEMYSLWTLMAVAAVALADRLADEGDERLWPAFCFLAGLFLGNRLDLVLLAPGLLWLALSRRARAAGEDGLWAGAALVAAPAASALSGSNLPAAALVGGTLLLRARGPGAGARLLQAAGWGLAGLSVYLFLPVRSATGPFLDWNHPSSLANFLDSILRTRYGGTLDLISRHYGVGAMLPDNLRAWGAHLFEAGVWGAVPALALWGAREEFLADRTRFLGRFAAWWWAGPVFLFLANMPPNAHALAIVEPHWLLSDCVMMFWAARGAATLLARAVGSTPEGGARSLAAGAALAALPLVAAAAGGTFARLDRRAHFAAPDFAANALRAVPPQGILIAKKDVQLYALWHASFVEGRRPGVRIASQGLAASPWYLADWRRRGAPLPTSGLTTDAGWAAYAALGVPVLATQDAEPPGAAAAALKPRGLARALAGVEAEDGSQWPLLVRRGARRTADAPDFFTKDLISGEAAAFYREGVRRHAAGDAAGAAEALTAAWAADGDFPDAPLFLGFLEARAGRMAEAAVTYGLADRLFEEKLALAARYRALPEVVASLRRQAAEAATHRGVALEKSGDPAAAEASYRRALSLAPLAQTRYNLAVLAWGRDWAAVEENLSEALRLDPNHADARRAAASLARARQR